MLKIHNAMWPGLVGKVEGTDQSPIALDTMLEMTAKSSVQGQSYDGVDLFFFHSHINPESSADEFKALADKIQGMNLKIGSLVAPVWPGTVGGCAFGSEDDRKNFLKAVKISCEFGSLLRQHGVRDYGVIRIDSAGNPEAFAEDEAANSKKLADTFKEAGKIAADHGERLAAEGEICWGGMHSWKHMLDTLEAVGMPETVGFQADLAHTYLYLLGYNAPEYALIQQGYSQDEFKEAYKTLTDKLRPWTIDFHVAQNDGSVHGSGSHDKTGRHCQADDPNGKLDIVECSKMWLQDYQDRGIKHICWDGCMFDNSVLTSQATWDTILDTLVKVRAAV
jgi:sugar phosphate isomerase/epimerase